MLHMPSVNRARSTSPAPPRPLPPTHSLPHPPPSTARRFAVNRRHAELFVNDTRLDPVFARDCFSQMDLTTLEKKPG